MICLAAALLLLAAPVADRAALDDAERVFAVEPSKVGGRVPVQWDKEGSGFVYRARAGWKRVDPETGRETDAGGPPRPPATPDQQPSPDGRTTLRVGPEGVLLEAAGATRTVAPAGEKDFEWQTLPRGWSPDGRWVIVGRDDTRGVHHVPVLDVSSPLESVRTVPYVKSGTPLSKLDLFRIDVSAGTMAPLALGDAEEYRWLAGWRPDTAEALVLGASRDGKRLTLRAADVATGTVRTVLEETNAATFVIALDFAVLDWAVQVTPVDRDRFLWMSERDGWKHAYLYGFDGALRQRVTTGAFPVHRVVAVDVPRKLAYVVASDDRERPYDQHVSVVPLAGGPLRRLTNTPGVHDPTFAPSRRFWIDRHSAAARAPVSELRRSDGRLVRVLEQGDARPFEDAGWAAPQELRVHADDGTTELWGALFLPPGFTPEKRYPVIDVIYAGPWLVAVPHAFPPDYHARLAASLARLGFVTVMLDARGTPGRSKAFQDYNYGRVGQTEIQDHVAALREAARTRPWMDMDRVGIVGHSWGGYFAIRGMLVAPGFFKAGYAGAPGDLTEEALINEPNLGLPGVNADAYRLGSNPARAADLAGPLKIAHGTADVNAPLSTTLRMVDALIRADRPFELLLFPGDGHAIGGERGRYYRDDIRRFFLRHLGGA